VADSWETPPSAFHLGARQAAEKFLAAGADDIGARYQRTGLDGGGRRSCSRADRPAYVRLSGANGAHLSAFTLQPTPSRSAFREGDTAGATFTRALAGRTSPGGGPRAGRRWTPRPEAVQDGERPGGETASSAQTGRDRQRPLDTAGAALAIPGWTLNTTAGWRRRGHQRTYVTTAHALLVEHAQPRSSTGLGRATRPTRSPTRWDDHGQPRAGDLATPPGRTGVFTDATVGRGCAPSTSGSMRWHERLLSRSRGWQALLDQDNIARQHGRPSARRWG
jgi:hypothetical protein